MTDSIRVFPPGFQVTNAAGTPQAGAVLRFYDAGTSNTRTVYSNPTLVTSLGVTVTTDSSGRPAASGGAGAEVGIYTGTTNYKVTAETSLAVSLWSFDNVVGAFDSSVFSQTTAIPETIISTKTTSYTVLTTDQGTLFCGTCTAGTVTFTLPSAITAGNGFRVGFKHTGTLNTVVVATVSSQTIDASTVLSITLPSYGSTRWLVSNGANWIVDQSFDKTPLIQNSNMTGATFSVDLRPYTAYRRIRIVMSGVIPATNATVFRMLTSTNGGSSYDSGAGAYAWTVTTMQMTGAGTLLSVGDDLDTSISLAGLLTSDTNFQTNLEVTLANQTEARAVNISWVGVETQSSGSFYATAGGAVRIASQDVDAVQFLFSAGNIANGFCSVFGDL